MPLSDYYGGRGREVMREMTRRYGDRGARVFYATANKQRARKARRRARRSRRG